MNDSTFNRSDVCLVVGQNSVSFKNFGCTGDIVQKYPYADVAGLREPDRNLKSFSKFKHRDAEGSVQLKAPPAGDKGPAVGTLITQYGIGRPLEENNISKKIVQHCPDTAVTSHLKLDTQEKRSVHFTMGMIKLSELLSLSYYKHIKSVIFPVGIGRSGKADNIWLIKYLPSIYSFTKDMQKCGKRIILLMPHYNELDHIFTSRKDHAAYCYRKMRNLQVLTTSDFLCDIPLTSYADIVAANSKDVFDNVDDDDDDDDDIVFNDDDLPATIPYYTVP